MLLDLTRCLCAGWGQVGELERVQPQPGAILAAQPLPRWSWVEKPHPLDGRLSTDVLLCRGNKPKAASSEAGGQEETCIVLQVNSVWCGELQERCCDRKGHRVMSQSWVPRCPTEMWPMVSVAWQKGAEEGFIGDRSSRLSRGGGSAGTRSGAGRRTLPGERDGWGGGHS